MEFWLIFVVLLFELVILLLVGAANITFTKKLERIADGLAEFAVQLGFIAGRIGLQRSDFRTPHQVGGTPGKEPQTDAIGFEAWDTSQEDAERIAEAEESGRRDRTAAE